MNEILEEIYPYEGGWARKLKLDLKRDPTIQRKIKDLGVFSTTKRSRIS